MTSLFDFAMADTSRYPGWASAWSGTNRYDSSHRYTLRRVRDSSKPFMQVIGLNPSTANEDVLDPTVTRVQKWGRAWGFGAKGLPPLHCLGTTMNGAPIHPLARGKHRVPDDVQRRPWMSLGPVGAIAAAR